MTAAAHDGNGRDSSWLLKQLVVTATGCDTKD
jgi:hypothetical protein